MELITELGNINWWAVVVATAVTMVLGTLWYGPFFGKKWMKLEGLTEDAVNNADGSSKVYAQMGIIALITSMMMAVLVRAIDVTSFMDLVIVGFLFGVVLRASTHYIHDGFSNRKPGVTLIHAGYDTLVIVLVTMIVGLWR